jgi:hypothetical protein
MDEREYNKDRYRFMIKKRQQEKGGEKEKYYAVQDGCDALIDKIVS